MKVQSEGGGYVEGLGLLLVEVALGD